MRNFTVYLTNRASNKVIRKVTVRAVDEHEAMSSVTPTRWERVYGASELSRVSTPKAATRLGGGW